MVERRGGEMQQEKRERERDSEGFYLYVCLHPFSSAPLPSVTLCVAQAAPFYTTSFLGKGQANLIPFKQNLI